MHTNRVTWYLNRLKAMDLPEVIYRTKLFVKKKIWKKFLTQSKLNISVGKIGGNSCPINLSKEHSLGDTVIDSLLEEADLYLDHKWIFFSLNAHEKEINWHLDPQSGKTAPLKFGFDINHRNEDLVGNIKNTWEKNRHHHLTVLALAYHLTGDEKYADEVELQLRSWVSQNPYLQGVNWTHPLEQGIRLISWVYIYFFLKNAKCFDSMFGADGFLWLSIHQHQKFIANTYSIGSSANNHLIGEMAGLYISCVHWPIFKESEKWKVLSKKILEREISRQTYDDGINKELAFSYQIFVIEFCMLALISNPADFSIDYKGVLGKMCKSAYSLCEIMGSTPNYGDGDEGMAIQLQAMDSDRLNWLFSLSNEYLKTSFRTNKSLPQLLFGCQESSFEETKSECFFSKESGILATKWNSHDSDLSMMIDFGPLGMGSLAAHGHADALSFVLNKNGKPVIIDAGTFSYHDNLKWRRYFRSTKAHNTLTIDGNDQSQQLGPFLWGARANCLLEEFDSNNGVLRASHDGYRGEGVIHRRRFNYSNTGLEITDFVEGLDEKLVEIRFHFHPAIDISIEAGFVKLPKEDIILEFDTKLEAKILKGDSEGGWYSQSFGSKTETNTLVLSQVLSLPVELATCIKINDKK